jgi:branched-chain amino acid transport system ATP-binding protein
MMDSTKLLQLKGVTKHFGGLTAVNNVSFNVFEGEIFGLIGPNGSGKTTIFNLINHYYAVSGGSIMFNDCEINRMQTFEIARLGIGRTFQVVKPLKRLTVEENVMAAAFARESTFQGARAVAKDTLSFCKLENVAHMKAGSLTIGGKKRLEIARALATKPRLLLLDETAAGLNPTELTEAVDIIRKIRDQLGITLLIVEHIMKVIMNISDRIHVIAYGSTIASGTPADVAANPAVIEAYLGSGFIKKDVFNA